MATTVTLPTSLVFLVTNFHSFVNIKLESSNYLLWRIQVENIMRANGFLGYLDGTIECPSTHVRNPPGEGETEGILVSNTEFTLWNLIDTQLLSCLTASLSATTLPYILGLYHTHEVWESLSNRYNTLSKSNIQDLKSKLYNMTKTSTIECYVDKIKEYSQKLAAAGSPVEDDDLIFHTLRGLPKVFNSFKTTVRGLQTRTNGITFNEVVSMLNGEDLQLLEESNSELENSTVLVATQGNQTGQGKAQDTGGIIDSMGQLGISPQQFNITPSTGGYNPQAVHFSGSNLSQQFVPQFRNFGRGRGRGPRGPCNICGRNNHSTPFCYYNPQFQSPHGSWRTPAQNGPWMNGYNFSHGASMYQPPPRVPMYQPQSQPQTPSMQQFNPSTSTHPTFAGFSEAYTVQGNYPVSGMSYPVDYGGTGLQSGSYPGYVTTTRPSTQTPAQPWYFDSGATSHITNNVQNLANPQPATSQEGILVGNGSHLQVTHTGKGQEHTQSSIQGALPQGAVPFSDLL